MADSKLDLKSMMAKLNELQVDDLNNIDWENMGSWPVAGKLIFCLIIFCVVSFGGYFYFVAEEIEQLESARQKEETLKRDFESKSFRAANLEAYKSQLEEMEETFGTLLQQLPRDTEVPGLIDDISAAALSSGLDLNLMDPQPIKDTEFYKELPINIEVTGGYHEMGAFVSAVASMSRIVTLHDYSITRSGQANKGGLNMKISAKTYQYNDNPKARATKGGKR